MNTWKSDFDAYGKIIKIEDGRCYYRGNRRDKILYIDYHNAKIRLANTKKNRDVFKAEEAYQRALAISQSFVAALENEEQR